MISAVHDSPVGPLTLKSNGSALTHLEFEAPRYPSKAAPRGEPAAAMRSPLRERSSAAATVPPTSSSSRRAAVPRSPTAMAR